jgi:hypothetical protein
VFSKISGWISLILGDVVSKIASLLIVDLLIARATRPILLIVFLLQPELREAFLETAVF